MKCIPKDSVPFENLHRCFMHWSGGYKSTWRFMPAGPPARITRNIIHQWSQMCRCSLTTYLITQGLIRYEVYRLYLRPYFTGFCIYNIVQWYSNTLLQLIWCEKKTVDYIYIYTHKGDYFSSVRSRVGWHKNTL